MTFIIIIILYIFSQIGPAGIINKTYDTIVSDFLQKPSALLQHQELYLQHFTISGHGTT